MGAAGCIKITEEDQLLSILPIHHTYESTIGFLVPLAKGSSIAICQGLKHIVPNLKETSDIIGCKMKEGAYIIKDWETFKNLYLLAQDIDYQYNTDILVNMVK